MAPNDVKNSEVLLFIVDFLGSDGFKELRRKRDGCAAVKYLERRFLQNHIKIRVHKFHNTGLKKPPPVNDKNLQVSPRNDIKGVVHT